MPLNDATAAFIGASVTLFLVIVFMILMVILVRQCLAFLAKRNALRAQTEQQQQARRQFERQRRGSITEPVPATFDWHHSIRIAGTPPPSYVEAKELPAYNEAIAPGKKKRGKKERGRHQQQQQQVQQQQQQVAVTEGDVIVTRNRSASAMENEERGGGQEGDNAATADQRRRHTSPQGIQPPGNEAFTSVGDRGGSLSLTIEQENERNSHLMTTELVSSPPHTVVEVETTTEESRGSVQVVSSGEEEMPAHGHPTQAT